MSRSNAKKPIAAAVGAALVTGVACAGVSSAAENPFGMTPLSSGYMQLATSDEGEAVEAHGGSEKMGAEGKCGEGKCGAKMSGTEGKCGGQKSSAEGKCGGEKKPSAEGESGTGQ